MEKLYTTKEVAEMLKLNERTIKRYVKEGTLKAVRIGSAVRITEQAIKDMMCEYNTQEDEKN